MDEQDFELIVVGAGICGIAAARFYLEVHPSCRVIVLEKDNCIGGVWNSRRSYKGFWTQWTVGAAEWSDMAMPRPPEDDLYFEFFEAKHTTKYLERYVDERVYAGQTLRDRIKLGFKVSAIKKAGGMWIVTDNTTTYRASKVIVASGQFSTPNIPDIPGIGNFEAPIIHQEGFGQSNVLSAQYQNITVVGGGKSSADMVYACVKAGKKVSWIIRASGTGPGFLLSTKGKGPYKNAFELGSTRLAGTLSPSLLAPDNWWTRFLHKTDIGQKITTAVWNGADKEARDSADFNRRPTALKGFEDLRPFTPIFWQNGTGGLLNRSDFWDVIAPNVHIYLDDIVRVSKMLVCLRKGQEIATDALLCGTGWNAASFDFFQQEDLLQLGLPCQIKEQPSEQAKLWARLEKQADSEILKQFPLLASPPKHPHKETSKTPYRLYNGIAPLNDNSIAFVGYLVVPNYFKAAECQAIWTTAFLDNKLDLPSLEERQVEIARLTSFCKRRYLSSGQLGNSVLFEANFYLDKLMREVGLTSHLKGWFRDYFKPGKAQDLAGLKDEYLERYGYEHRQLEQQSFDDFTSMSTG